MSSFVPVLAIVLLAAALSLRADDLIFKSSPAASLVELYSSEGCSSCPPAEAWITRMKNEPGLWKNLFPVVFHVDYWDNLGWPDRFARPIYTERQRNYAARLGQASVYTPEFVVDGREWRGWFDGGKLSASAKTGELTLTVHFGKLSASYRPATSSLQLNVALLGAGLVSDVQRGENGGRKLVHDFVVLDFQTAPLSGMIGLKSSTDDPPAAVVAWVSRPDGSIAQVAGGWLNPYYSTLTSHSE